ncbi:MAG: hypothetical protein ABIV10_16675 [Gemmatimonadaceae bacterium]
MEQSETAAPHRPAAATAKWRSWFAIEHLGLAITMAYLALAGLGMLHRALVFLRFRINVLDYAEPSDFLMAALRDPLIVLVCIAPIPVLALYYRGATWVRNRLPQNHVLTGGRRAQDFQRRHRSTLFAFTVALWALAASLHYAKHVATELREGRGRRVQIELLSGNARSPGDTTTLLLLGTTQKYVFLYNPARQVSSVIPVSNVAQLWYERRQPAKRPVQ